MPDFRIVSRADLDLRRWNDMCLKEEGDSLYNQAWFLDAMTQKSWSAIVMDDYVAALPFYRKKKWFISYVVPPLLCQRMAIMGKADDTQRRLLYERLLQQGCKVVVSSDDQVPEGFTVGKKVNHIVSLSGSYDEISQKFNRNTRRNLNDFMQSGLTLEAYDDVKLVCQFLAKHDQTGLIARYIKNFEDLMVTSMQQGCGHILVSLFEEALVSVGFYIEWQSRIYFLLCASDATGKKYSATYAIIDAILQKYAGAGLIFDFTGSGIPGVARRNEGFGAITETYWQYHKNRI